MDQTRTKVRQNLLQLYIDSVISVFSLKAKPLLLNLRELLEFVLVGLFDGLDCAFMTSDLLSTTFKVSANGTRDDPFPLDQFRFCAKPSLLCIPLTSIIVSILSRSDIPVSSITPSPSPWVWIHRKDQSDARIADFAFSKSVSDISPFE